jgi:hypothetical protein
MFRYIHFIKPKHLIFLNGGSTRHMLSVQGRPSRACIVLKKSVLTLTWRLVHILTMLIWSKFDLPSKCSRSVPLLTYSSRINRSSSCSRCPRNFTKVKCSTFDSVWISLLNSADRCLSYIFYQFQMFSDRISFIWFLEVTVNKILALQCVKKFSHKPS